MSWLGRNVDVVVAPFIAVSIAILEIFSNLSAGVFSTAILLVLAMLSVVLLRDRERLYRLEPTLRATSERTGELARAVDGVGDRLDRALSDASMVRVVTGSDVTAAHAEARRGTEKWLFRGGTGTYMRAVTLKECIAGARLKRRRLRVRMEIIDPTSEDLCRRYARFRQSVVVDGQPVWTVERTQREAYATILAACWYRQRNEFLDLEVALASVMPTLRWDMSTSMLIITQENPQGPALTVESGKLLYTYVETELSKSFEQARRVPVERGAQVDLPDEPATADVRTVFAAMDMPLPRTFTDSDVDDIVERALRPKNPYAP